MNSQNDKIRELEEELARARKLNADAYTAGYMMGTADARDVIRQMGREADWLAQKAMWECDQCHNAIKRHCIIHKNGQCDGYGKSNDGHMVGVKHWRDAAREAVKNVEQS